MGQLLEFSENPRPDRVVDRIGLLRHGTGLREQRPGPGSGPPRCCLAAERDIAPGQCVGLFKSPVTGFQNSSHTTREPSFQATANYFRDVGLGNGRYRVNRATVPP